MVAADDDHVTDPGVAQRSQKTVVELLDLGRRVHRVEDVARDDERIDLARRDGLMQPA